jgi:hypothetical protein
MDNDFTEEMREYFEADMTERGHLLSYKRNKDGYYTNRITAISYDAFVSGCDIINKAYLLKQMEDKND